MTAMRYFAAMQHQSSTVEPWIARHAAMLRAGTALLDVACGYGRHAKFFASRGVLVTAVDRDAAAVATLQNVANLAAELRDIEGSEASADAWPYAPNAFDAIIVCNYLWRPTFSAMLDSLKPGGTLIYETFMDGNERYGKPSRSDFLLRSNELLEVLRAAFSIRAYEEGEQADDVGRVVAMKARVAAVKRMC
jgi:SAM-dependent methyltransferase